MTGEHAVGRVIARPFEGEPGSLCRREGRRDYACRRRGARIWRSPGCRRAGARRRQDPRPVRGRRGGRQAPGATNAAGLAATTSFFGSWNAGSIREPGRDRPGLRPPPRRRGFPSSVAGDRRRGARVAGDAARRRPPDPDRRSRRRPDRSAHRPHSGVRAAVGRVRRFRADVGTTVCWPTWGRAPCAGSPAGRRVPCRAQSFL